MEASDHSDLMKLDVQRAIAIKFQRGRVKYGGEEWVGPEPIVAAHDELLDAAVYIGLERVTADGDPERAMALEALMRTVLDAIRGVRLLA